MDVVRQPLKPTGFAVNFDFDFRRYAMKPTLAKLRGIIADAG
jgi:hypothetical protein